MDGTLNSQVRGKIVICQLDQQRKRQSGELRNLAINVANAGGRGIIVMDERLLQAPNYVVIPCALIDLAVGSKLKQYIFSRRYDFKVITILKYNVKNETHLSQIKFFDAA